jgi:beta-lactamase superfamily II metal-dependent hydrolase
MLHGEMVVRVWDVEHGACAMLHHTYNGQAGRLAMIDSGCTDDWRPSTFIRNQLKRATLDYLFITNADQDHMSDLKGLDEAGVSVPVLIRNPTYTRQQIASIKALAGPLSRDASWYVNACGRYNQQVTEPFNQYMGGITATWFFNPYPRFVKTNDLSLVVFIQYAGFKILFPGDLEVAGWRALLTDPSFRAELTTTNILVASHHGRQNGYCDDVFDFLTPDAVVISDKPIVHDTQRTVPDYRRVVREDGVIVRTTMKRRHVLTTRRDGSITFTVGGNGSYYVDTEYAG